MNRCHSRIHDKEHRSAINAIDLGCTVNSDVRLNITHLVAVPLPCLGTCCRHFGSGSLWPTDRRPSICAAITQRHACNIQSSHDASPATTSRCNTMRRCSGLMSAAPLISALMELCDRQTHRRYKLLGKLSAGITLSGEHGYSSDFAALLCTIPEYDIGLLSVVAFYNYTFKSQ